MFVEKISIYLLGATFYFSRITKQDIDVKHNSDPSARDTTFNEILANRDARFLTELTDYRAKFNAELTSRDENFTAEVQRILTMLNTSTARLDEIERVFQAYNNNFERILLEFASIRETIVILQNGKHYAIVRRIDPIEEPELQDIALSDQQSEANLSENSSESSERGCSLDEMCNIVAVEILNLRIGKLGSKLDKIGTWIDSKANNSLSGRSNYQLPPEVGRFSGKKWSEISARTAQKDLQKEAQNYVIRKNWDLYSSLLDNHNLIMNGMGQQQHIMDIGLLESAFHRPKFMFFYEKASLYRMAAGLGESIIKNHPFLDGNKRAGHLSISAFLLLNGYDLVADKVSTEKITLGVAMGNINIDILESWIASNVKPYE
ncbi:10044_t:CDS:2 [Ambispora gerdemannii]|uniref:10044_t:CDS:1 n=1 Tax=Ambispora gerdemannii TaxID=144530 RepID=A0A9N9AAJ3_9GLOM|nr:10044_t:CDS:2 [Ambispora gerdemannii]